MRAIELFRFPLFLLGILLVFTIPFQSCDPDDDGNDTCPLLKKPNIYIYPDEKIQLSVSLIFPLGGNIINSLPDYGSGWNITVDTNGLIDNTYNYLFYESIQPDVWQQNEGWLVKKADLEFFFTENMTKYGFSGREIPDYLDYWIPRLAIFEWYVIYPQNVLIINEVIRLNFSKKPDNVLRLFYLIKGYYDMPNIKLADPEIGNGFERKGFTVTEWGVILK
ncbi:MAG: hypothetical protein NT175_01270 [Bacteroidetes bacterium]|nr:hypothetical protein [Bacteroidota bacterium]